MSETLATRRKESQARLDELLARTGPLEEMLNAEPLCIYVTGSYGRLEARVGDASEDSSDLDLFFLYGGEPEEELPRTIWFRLAGRLIELVEELGFPPFSGDAEFLEFHHVHRMREQLGGRDDDSVNAFTARMLLLLESRPLVNASVYDRLVSEVIGFYFDDFEQHGDHFRATFLLNDILRFWRTLTLNYEHRRRGRFAKAGGNEDKLAKARQKTAIQNFKLGFSRLSTCFSMVVPLAAAGPPISPARVEGLAAQSPTERWESLGDPRRAELLDHYAWFLEITGHADQEESTFADPKRRAAARERERRFGDLVFEILRDTADPAALRFVVV